MKKYLALLLLVFSLPLIAAKLPDTAKLETFEDFSGGVNMFNPAHKLPPNESPSMLNVLIDEGSIETIPGFTVAGSCSSLTKITMMYEFNKPNGGKELLISDNSKVLATSDLTSWKLVKEGISSVGQIYAVQARDKVWFTNGVDYPFTYDGSTVVVMNGGSYGGVTYPTAPKGKYVAYWLGLLWFYSLPGDTSALQFCADQSTDTVPVAIAPDNENAWPGYNVLYVGRGDGDDGSGLFVYRGQLYCSKYGRNRGSIHMIYGSDTSNFVPKPTESEAGFASQDSIKLHKGLVFGLAKDGVIAFNGVNSEPVSDNITEQIDDARKETASNVLDIWDTDTQFEKGSSSGVYISDGLLKFPDPVTVTTTVPSASSKRQGAVATDLTLKSTGTVTDIGRGRYVVEKIKLYGCHDNALGVISTEFIVKNLNSNTSTYYHNSYQAQQCAASPPTDIRIYEMNNLQDYSFYDNFSCSNDEILHGSVTIKMTVQISVSGGYIMADGSSYAGPIVTLKPKTTASYESDVATIATITAWSSLDSSYENNTGSVSFYYRTSTSSVNIATYPWIPITPGSVIGSTISDNYIQWAATFTYISTQSKPSIDWVTISHIEGQGSDTRALAEVYEDRYHLFITTDLAGNFKAGYVYGIGGGWMPIQGINIKSMILYNGLLHGGDATSGNIYRLYNGTSFNGVVIPSYYDTRESMLDDYVFDKSILNYTLDYEKCAGCNLTLYTYVDGIAKSTKTISIEGSGRGIKPLKYFSGSGNRFKWRFENNSLDKQMKIHRFGVIYNKNTESMSDK